MAKDNSKNIVGGVMGSDDGYLYVRGLEDKNLSEYLATYMAKIVAYRVEDRDYGHRVTMRIDYPADTRPANVNLWTFFIAQAAHKIGKKPFIEVVEGDDVMIGYCSFTVYKSVKFMESKQEDKIRF